MSLDSHDPAVFRAPDETSGRQPLKAGVVVRSLLVRQKPAKNRKLGRTDLVGFRHGHPPTPQKVSIDNLFVAMRRAVYRRMAVLMNLPALSRRKGLERTKWANR
ncbi:hypothetical protein [Methylopila sp. M107]|uniref:hypothetical protein n=1 Tax=Methylopila sp. M107 TaxID=1101190 RepID=UPI0012DD2EBD|nr:hypothetical protein [Methylopila sp. M107]